MTSESTKTVTKTGSNLDLFDVVGRHEEADSYGNEDEADDEECGQHGPRGQDGLPCRQALLFEGGVVGLSGPDGGSAEPRGSGEMTVFLFRVVAGRHNSPNYQLTALVFVLKHTIPRL